MLPPQKTYLPLPYIHSRSSSAVSVYPYNIVFDVPYSSMKSGNDCWHSILRMMASFYGKAEPPDPNVAHAHGGHTIGGWNRLLVNNQYEVRAHSQDVKSPNKLYDLLQEFGPLVTALVIGERTTHAIIITGVVGDRVLINNPENEFKGRDAHHKTKLIEDGIVSRYGGISFKEWKAKNPGRLTTELASGLLTLPLGVQQSALDSMNFPKYVEDMEGQLRFRKNRSLKWEQFRQMLPGPGDEFGQLWSAKGVRR